MPLWSIREKSQPLLTHPFSITKKKIRRVVLIGPMHKIAVRGIVIPSSVALSTPLGDVLIDRASFRRMQTWPEVQINDDAFKGEHALEMQLLFLSSVLKGFSIVPMLICDVSVEELVQRLRELWGGDETLIVISSDLSHFHPAEKAEMLDAVTIEAIEKGKPEEISRESACGTLAIQALLHLVKEKNCVRSI